MKGQETMKKNSKKWRKIQKEKELRRTTKMVPSPKVPKESVCTHYLGFPCIIPSTTDPKRIPCIITPIYYPSFSNSVKRLFDGSNLCHQIRKSSTDQCHCKICKTEFSIDCIEKMDTLIQYLKRPDWNGEEADKLAIGIEPVRYIKDGKKIMDIEKLGTYYSKFHKKFSLYARNTETHK